MRNILDILAADAALKCVAFALAVTGLSVICLSDSYLLGWYLLIVGVITLFDLVKARP